MDNKQEPPSAKRAKTTAAAAPHFELLFAEAGTLRRLVDIGSTVLKELDFEVVADDDFRGVQVRCIDTKSICMLMAKLACSVPVPPVQKARFSVNASLLATCLRGVPANFAVSVNQLQGESDLRIVATPGNENADRQQEKIEYTMPTLVTGDPPPNLESLAYQYNLSLDLSTFRGIVKQAKDFSSDFLALEVATDDDGRQQLVMRAEGKVGFERRFEAHDEDEGSDEGGGERQAVSERFSTDYLVSMTKGMDRGVIVLRLSQGQPLLLTHGLDGDQSVVHFILAPRCDD